jgi:hypothetical protein
MLITSSGSGLANYLHLVKNRGRNSESIDRTFYRPLPTTANHCRPLPTTKVTNNLKGDSMVSGFLKISGAYLTKNE